MGLNLMNYYNMKIINRYIDMGIHRLNIISLLQFAPVQFNLLVGLIFPLYSLHISLANKEKQKHTRTPLICQLNNNCTARFIHCNQ